MNTFTMNIVQEKEKLDNMHEYACELIIRKQILTIYDKAGKSGR